MQTVRSKADVKSFLEIPEKSLKIKLKKKKKHYMPKTIAALIAIRLN